MPKKKARGKRYSEEEQKEILAFMAQINAEKGRGGAAAASRKFGVSQLTVAKWAQGSPSSGSPTRRLVKTSSSGKNAFAKMAKTLDRIESLKKEIGTLEKEYARLRKRIP